MTVTIEGEVRKDGENVFFSKVYLIDMRRDEVIDSTTLREDGEYVFEDVDENENLVVVPWGWEAKDIDSGEFFVDRPVANITDYRFSEKPYSFGTHQWFIDDVNADPVEDVIGELDAEVVGDPLDTGEGYENAIINATTEGNWLDLGDASKTELNHFTQDGDGTFFCWVNPTDLDGNRSILGSGIINKGINLWSSDGELRFTLHDGDDAVVSVETELSTDLGWIPIAVTLEEGLGKLYLADPLEEIGDDEGTPPGTDFDLPAQIGSDAERGYPGVGKIDIPFFDKKPWSKEELQFFVDKTSHIYE